MKGALRQIMDETQNVHQEAVSETQTILRKDRPAATEGDRLATLLVKAGYRPQAGPFAAAALALFVALLAASQALHFGMLGAGAAALAAIFLPLKHLSGRARRQSDAFVDAFPEALNMIVRSLRSGFPLPTAMKLVAENLQPPVSTEFQQVCDEVALGRPLDEALAQLAQRVDTPDVKFFVVVLKVQNETGGNLAEALADLASMIRKRKQLQMKIKSMTSEGRAMSWILGALPVIVFGMLLWVSPDYLRPLFDSATGNAVLVGAIGMVAAALWVVRQMAKIDI